MPIPRPPQSLESISTSQILLRMLCKYSGSGHESNRHKVLSEKLRSCPAKKFRGSISERSFPKAPEAPKNPGGPFGKWGVKSPAGGASQEIIQVPRKCPAGGSSCHWKHGRLAKLQWANSLQFAKKLEKQSSKCSSNLVDLAISASHFL